MGSLFSGSTTTKTPETAKTGPSDFQQPYLTDLFGGAQAANKAAQGTPFYQGDTFAGKTPEEQARLQALQGFAGTTGMAGAGALTEAGMGLAGNAGKASGALDAYSAMANEDGTQSIIDNAGRYANNQYTDDLITANTRDISRNLTEQVLPGIDRAASGTGNINSSRAGIASGVAQRGAADRVGDISAQIRGDQYARGLDMAQRERAGVLASKATAAQGYGALAGQGFGAIQAGAGMGYDAFGQQIAAGEAGQADRQGQMDADFAKWAGNDTRQYDLLNRYKDIVASNQWGQNASSSGKSVSKEKPSIMSSIMQAASMAASFSDIRLKKNIVKVGEEADGLGIYEFDYKDGHGLPTDRQLGVMAHEVSQLRPEALGPVIGGYSTVNYKAL